MNIQTLAALTIVFLTAAIFLYFSLNKKKGDCAGGCGCSKSVKNNSEKNSQKI